MQAEVHKHTEEVSETGEGTLVKIDPTGSVDQESILWQRNVNI